MPNCHATQQPLWKLLNMYQNDGFIFLGYKPLLLNVSKFIAHVVKLKADALLSSAHNDNNKKWWEHSLKLHHYAQERFPGKRQYCFCWGAIFWAPIIFFHHFLIFTLFGWSYNKKYLFAKLVDIFRIQKEKKMKNFNELQGENTRNYLK